MLLRVEWGYFSGLMTSCVAYFKNSWYAGDPSLESTVVAVDWVVLSTVSQK